MYKIYQNLVTDQIVKSKIRSKSTSKGIQALDEVHFFVAANYH